MSRLTQDLVWQALLQHYQAINSVSINEHFSQDSNRFNNFSLIAADIFFDYSKHRINLQTIELLCSLAQKKNLSAKIDDLFSGAIVNQSEQLPALHTALRQFNGRDIIVNNFNITEQIKLALEKMTKLVDAIRQRQLLGFAGKPIDSILHIGIGGSYLGPLAVYTALEKYSDKKISCFFVADSQPNHLKKMLNQLNPATTLIFIASKSFTSKEVMANARLAQNWMIQSAPSFVEAQKQWFACTAHPERAGSFQILPEQVLPLGDWIGGRFSLWSAMSLTTAVTIGMERFCQLLAGARKMDEHFREMEFKRNMPVLLALLDIWYINFYGVQSKSIIPYDQNLNFLPDHLQQLHMESLGKRVNSQGLPVDYDTGSVVWGGTGTLSQHSFHQLLLQGTRLVPIDFILPLPEQLTLNSENYDTQYIADCLAQSQVLMQGNHGSQNADQEIVGNQASSTFVFKLTPFTLGALLALYEHKVYVMSVIWDIDAFDQWGVERGKYQAREILGSLSAASNKIANYDQSTIGLMEWVKQLSKI